MERPQNPHGGGDGEGQDGWALVDPLSLGVWGVRGKGGA